MLVAQKSSNAYKLEEESVSQPQQRAKKVKVPKNNRTYQNKSILSIVVFIGVAFYLLLRYAAITEASNQTLKLKTELKSLQKQSQQMQVEIDRSINLKVVEDNARNKLGMKRPDKSQTIYVSLKRQDYSQVVAQDSLNNNQTGIFALISGSIQGILKYLY